MLSSLQGSEISPPLSRKRSSAPIMSVSKDERQRILAPFDLRNDINILGEPKNLAYFNTIFPGNEGFAHDELFLYIYHTPPQPPPKSFAGVPIIFVSTKGQMSVPPTLVLPQGLWVPSRQGSIADHLDYRHRQDFDWQPLFDAIRLHFDSLKVSITEVIYWGHFVHIVLEHKDTVMSRLPCQVGRITCRYLFEKDMHRPDKLQAHRRAKDPKQNNVVDDTTYDILQPGVRVSSDYVPGSQTFLSTTLGTRVWDADGNDYITVAAHGFPNVCGVNVFHGLRNDGRLVGQLARRIGTTDIALMRLSKDELFVNETFVSDITDGESSLLRGLRHPRQFDVVSLDSPETGYLDGQVMAVARRKIPSDEAADEQSWVAVDWLYQGLDAGELPFLDSMCGTVACGTDRKVVSFFQYVFKEGPWKNWCIGTSAKELLERGFN